MNIVYVLTNPALIGPSMVADLARYTKKPMVKVSERRKTRMNYFDEEDVLHIVISEEKESGSVELSPNITAELNEKGELIGIEILNASNYVRDSILEGVQAKLLNLHEAHSAVAGT